MSTAPKLRRVMLFALVLSGLLLALILADTVGEATLRMHGVVVEVDEVTPPRRSAGPPGSVRTRQARIAIPGKTFWWSGSYSVGARVGVHVLDGRFSGFRYVRAVEDPALTSLQDAYEDFSAGLERSRDFLR